MRVNAPFKQTDLGFIPQDWEVLPLGEIADTSSGTTPPRALRDRYYKNGEIPWVKTLDLNNSEIYSTDEKVTQTALRETSLTIFPPGTVLVAMYGGHNQIGRTGLIRIHATVNQAVTAIRQRNGRLRPEYLLLTFNFRVRHWRSVASSSRKDPNITSRDIRNFLIPLPPRMEQEAIADALGDADALIQSLEDLVAKKHLIKQGAMQELLTGKRRLPGFRGEWSARRLGELSDVRSGGTPNTFDERCWDGDIPWCTPTDITANSGLKYVSSTSRSITPFGLRASSAEIIPARSILMTSRATIGECAINTVEMCTNQGFKNLVPAQCTNVEFLYYLLTTKRQDLVELASGSTFLEIGKAQLLKIEVQVPASLTEQSAIAEVLSDMDAEIFALQTKLAKTRHVKQGMMQELLIGKIRLV